MQPLLRTSRSDVSARKTYDLLDEPTGPDYAGLLECALVHAHDAQANAWSFVAIFLFVVIVVEVLGALLNERLEKLAVAAFDRIGGVLVGAIVGVAEVLILFLVAISVGATNATPHSSMSQDIHAATLSGQVVRLEPQVRTLFAPVLPSNLTDHFDQNTGVLTPPV